VTNRNDNVYTAIVLQGGGALGAYEYGVLKALYERRPGFTPVAVTGISIGAVTAAVLGGAKGDPMKALDTMWREKFTVSAGVPLPPVLDRSLAALGDRGMYRFDTSHLMQLVLAPWTLTNIYDTAPLRTTLTELVDLKKLNGEHPGSSSGPPTSPPPRSNSSTTARPAASPSNTSPPAAAFPPASR